MDSDKSPRVEKEVKHFKIKKIFVHACMLELVLLFSLVKLIQTFTKLLGSLFDMIFDFYSNVIFIANCSAI